MEKITELLMGFRSLLRLYDKMLKKVCREYDLSVIEADVVSFLQNNPGKDTAVDIVELRMLSKGAVSKAVESLMQKSLLERIPDREDRRRIHLKLKPEASDRYGEHRRCKTGLCKYGPGRIHKRRTGYPPTVFWPCF